MTTHTIKSGQYPLWRFLAISSGVWFLVFALTVSESLFFYQINQKPAPYWNIILNDLFILCWIPISPVLYFFTKRWYKHKSNWLNFSLKLLLILIGALAFVLFSESLIHYFERLGSDRERTFDNIYFQLISFRFHSNLILGLGFLATSVAALAYTESRKLAERQEALNRNLVEAQLGILKAQMKPHFLFNSLHAISGLVLKKENDLAITVIAKLSDLLRESLNMDEKNWITLKEEIDFIKRYLEIYALRFGEQLTYTFDIEEETELVLVPPAFLQPIVENALVHRVIPNDNRGHVLVKAYIQNDNLNISVKDIVETELQFDVQYKEGMGLGNTRKRLASLFGDHFKLKFDPVICTTEVVFPILNTSDL
ncbi:Histidine kinase [Reichenbachiella faecimaris]|uniref:Histidine kinase n=1 Tax=Reichenbachiella faecimaris TaxID=692418 RepID=A0A1W2G5M7_REIFA|nr:histidine kinase [Reichenbachiella faecimaris]SMD31979.1 Histidine kinase [Reichenbachiella faecimaris]